ncbi:MAG: phosphoenolpyruvate--protein phosphotransferase [Candidatus Hydrogenedentes bacterium]|nr:phosphoenolpyruvate--protein phosphotransferase [Candidatus Hydrogenedentota bacterium]
MAEKNITAKKVEQRMVALPISDGIACAPVRIITRDSGEYVPRYHVSDDHLATEKERLATALRGASEALDKLIALVKMRVGAVQANIFLAQKMIVEDETLVQDAVDIIEKKHINAESACVDILDSYESKLLELDDDYLKDRASDIGEVRRRILDMFHQEQDDFVAETPTSNELDAPCIIVAEELMPGETIDMNTSNTAGFLTERGGPASHVAVLARAMGIPAVSGVKDLLQKIGSDDHVIINGTTGECIVNPVRKTLNLYPALGRITPKRTVIVPPVPGFEVYANINTASEVDLALSMGAEGIGLYRTEFEYIQADRILSEDEQYERYAHVVKRMEGRPVYIRLADLGGDKAAHFLNLPSEDNPALGYRGARLLLGQPDLLGTQAKAIARASSHGPIRVTYPMIVDEQQFLKLRTQFIQSIEGIDTGKIEHGVMFEVPAACICAEKILQAADFGSIGTNDLVQYLFAVDRDNGLVAGDYTPDRPAFWEMIKHITRSAQKCNRPLSLCGEIGGQPLFLPKLLEHKIQCVSVSSRLIGLARMTARRAQHLMASQ